MLKLKNVAIKKMKPAVTYTTNKEVAFKNIPETEDPISREPVNTGEIIPFIRPIYAPSTAVNINEDRKVWTRAMAIPIKNRTNPVNHGQIDHTSIIVNPPSKKRL